MIKIHPQSEAAAPEALPVTPRQPVFIPPQAYDIVPQVFFLELTNHCNMHCTFCPSDYLKKDRAMADDTQAVQFIEQVRDLDMKRPIQFSVLGEPLLNKKIYKYIDLCEQYEIEVYLISNFAILDAERARKVFHHHNVALVLSLQTPTEDSYQRLRGYDKLTFDQYFDRIYPALREKFIQGSRSRVEIHVTSTSNMRADAAIQSDFELDMWDAFSPDEKTAFVTGLLDRFDGFAAELRAEFPEQFEAEHARSLQQYAEQIGSGHLAATRATVPPDAADLIEERFWGYMFAPNCFIRFKTFGMWTKEPSFMQTFLPKQSLTYVEERTEALDCAMAHNVAMLADGQLSLCCLDYEGEMGLPNLREMPLVELLTDSKRTAIAKDAMQTEVCRRCQGTMFVFDTEPNQDTQAPVTKFGRGWHAYEAELGGAGGRWSSGHALSYFYARAGADTLALRFLSVHDSALPCRAELRRYDPATKEFGAVEQTLPFFGKQNEIIEVALAAAFEAGQLYRIDLHAPTFVPAQQNGGGDQRELGLAVLSTRVLQRPAPAVQAAPPAPVAEVVENAPAPASRSRLRSWLGKYLG
ncbi:Radical SAM superfamily protein [Duganella sp. CF402]|uniref:radical SAM/SPASM domain-containing protein n=1 Tax=unclassified Duganella TaxID=2636909 RepID=UPI0008BA8914|nr:MULTISPECIES: radical SAM protein [unclassified Duganella]RZT08677.1 iron-sulfur cluster protein [Duganella sp. BK701]SEL85711.1 Radical SAM superfamily protein [Duganella sp. CF402]